MRNAISSLMIVVLLFVASRGVMAQQKKPQAVKPLREIFVPYDDLEVLLEGDLQRVFLTEKQYKDLLQRAERSPIKNAPHSSVALSGNYAIQIVEGER